MGKASREKPKRLPRKLLLIRKRLGISQSEMAKALKLKAAYTAVSGYELGTREPSLIVVLRYARLAGISTDVLLDDKLNLPDG